MSTRSATETVVRLVQALVEERTWSQADLARKVGVLPRTVAARLSELRAAGVPLEREVRGVYGRFIARCHRDDQLKWFRVDGVMDAALDPAEPYRPAVDAEVEALLASSVDGFHAGGDPLACEIFVRDPDARWAARNLPCPMTVATVTDVRVDSDLRPMRRSRSAACPCRRTTAAVAVTAQQTLHPRLLNPAFRESSMRRRAARRSALGLRTDPT